MFEGDGYQYDPETQKMLDEASELVNKVLSKLTLDQLFYFSHYISVIKDDYDQRDRKYFRTEPEKRGNIPSHRKLPGYEDRDWWEIIQPLFNKNDGENINGLVFMFIERFIHKKAREHQGYIPPEEYPNVEKATHAVAVQEATAGMREDVLARELLDENDPQSVSGRLHAVNEQKSHVNALTALRSSLEAKPITLPNSDS